MRKKWKNRCFAWALVGTMAFSGYPSVSVSAEENELSKLAEFNFDADASTPGNGGGGGGGPVIGGCGVGEWRLFLGTACRNQQSTVLKWK